MQNDEGAHVHVRGGEEKRVGRLRGVVKKKEKVVGRVCVTLKRGFARRGVGVRSRR